MCDCSLKLSVKERTTMTADFSPQNPQSKPGQRSPSPSFIFFGVHPYYPLAPYKGNVFLFSLFSAQAPMSPSLPFSLDITHWSTFLLFGFYHTEDLEDFISPLGDER